MILFFETYSIIQTIFLFRHIKKAKVIYFHKRSFPQLKSNRFIERIVIKIIRFLNSSVCIETLPAKKINEPNWIANRKAVDIVEDMESNINESASYKTMLKIIRDENILKYYKRNIADDVSARILFFRVVQEFIDEYGNIAVIPSCNDYQDIQEVVGEETVDQFILQESFLINRLRDACLKLYALFIFLFLPFAYLILNLKKIRLKKIVKKKFDIAMPVIWGFHESDVIIGGVKWDQDDGYLYNKEITPGHIIHIFNHWRFSPEVTKSYKSIMDKKCISYIDARDYKIGTDFLIIVLTIQLKILQYFSSVFFAFHEKHKYIMCNNHIIYMMLKKYLEFENVDYKVEFVRSDYSGRHIIDTILCNQHNKKTVGIQHGSTAGPYVFNCLCYVHFDKYCIFSDRHLELYSPYWNRLNLRKVGNYRIDHLVEISKDKSLLTEIRRRLTSLYGKRKYLVLILFPSPSEYNLINKWDEIYEGLYEMQSIDIDCTIMLRFRSTDNLEFEHLKRFKTLTEVDSRFVIDLTNFTTYELMAISDIVISNSHSSGMIDGVALNRRTFTFDFMGTAKYCFKKYGKDIILYGKEDILNIFKNLENNFIGYDCNWDLLRKEYNYYYDGTCLSRLQRVIIETLKEIH